MNYINSPQYNGLPMDLYNPAQNMMPTQNPYGFNPNAPQMMGNMRPAVDPRLYETPKITMEVEGQKHKPLFSVSSEGGNKITVDNTPDMAKEAKPKKKKSSSKKESTAIITTSDAQPLSGTVEDNATIYSYQETNNLLHDTLIQVDAINAELVQEFSNVRHNRTMKNKYNVLTNLSENIGSMLNNRIAIIKEINNCITKSNDMDYKKYKDIKAAESTMNDDKYVADMYQAFISNPQQQAPVYQMPPVDPAIMSSGIVRATLTPQDLANTNTPIDVGYMNYMANLTPEQNMMRYEGNPNVKQCVVYDAQSGNRYFQMMDLSTGEAITNVPVYDAMFLEDTTLDLQTKIAKNLNLNETFPIIVINDNITSQY